MPNTLSVADSPSKVVDESAAIQRQLPTVEAIRMLTNYINFRRCDLGKTANGTYYLTSGRDVSLSAWDSMIQNRLEAFQTNLRRRVRIVVWQPRWRKQLPNEALIE